MAQLHTQIRVIQDYRFPFVRVEKIENEYLCVTVLFGLFSWGSSGAVTLFEVAGFGVYKRASQVCSLAGAKFLCFGWVHDRAVGWRHRPFWKVAANTILRTAQFWTSRPLVIVSEVKTENLEADEPVVERYHLRRVPHNRRGEWRE